jgi:predicted DsbA family dithiol-disulfide isomerase
MGLNIVIVGKGCYFCRQLHKIVGELLEELQVEGARVEQTDDMEELLSYGVVNPPALIVNGKLKMMGRVLVRTRIRQAIMEELPATQEDKPSGPQEGT